MTLLWLFEKAMVLNDLQFVLMTFRKKGHRSKIFVIVLNGCQDPQDVISRKIRVLYFFWVKLASGHLNDSKLKCIFYSTP